MTANEINLPAGQAQEASNTNTTIVPSEKSNTKHYTDASDQENATARTDTHELESIPEDIRTEAEAMLSDPKMLESIVSDVHTLGVANEQYLVATIYLVGTSRLLDRPLAVIVYGQYSSGKSYLIDKVAKLFPTETVIRSTDITPQVLYYIEEGGLVHRFVIAGERSHRQQQDAMEATKDLREMISAGQLDKRVTVKGGNNQYRTIHIH